jgi:hypothetical protein
MLEYLLRHCCRNFMWTYNKGYGSFMTMVDIQGLEDFFGDMDFKRLEEPIRA